MSIQTYTVKQVADILGFSTNSIYTFLKEKRIKGIRIGKTGRFRITEDELQHLLGVYAKHTTAVSANPVTPAPLIIKSQKLEHIRLDITRMMLVDWYIGILSLLVGLSLCLYSPTQETAFFSTHIVWFVIIRILFISLGVGILASKLIAGISTKWIALYKVFLTGVFGVFAFMSFFSGDFVNGLMGAIMTVYLPIILFFSFSDGVSFILLIAISVILSCIIGSIYPSVGQTIFPFFEQIQHVPVVAGIIGVITTLYLIALFRTRNVQGFQHKTLLWLFSLFCVGFSVIFAVTLQWTQMFFGLLTGLMVFLVPIWSNSIQLGDRRKRRSMIFFSVIIAVFLFGILMVYVMELAMNTYGQMQLEAKVENGKQYLDSVLNSATYIVRSKERNTDYALAVTEKNRELLTKLAKDEFETSGLFRRVIIMDQKGNELGHYPADEKIRGANFAQRPYFSPVVTNKTVYISDTFESISTVPRSVIVVAGPIFDPKTNLFEGIFLGSLDMEVIGYRLQKLAASQKGEYYSVFDRSGNYIIHPSTDLQGKSIQTEDRERLKRSIDSNLALKEWIFPNNVRVYGAYRGIAQIGGGIIAAQSIRSLYHIEVFSFMLVSVLCVVFFVTVYIFVFYDDQYRKNPIEEEVLS